MLLSNKYFDFQIRYVKKYLGSPVDIDVDKLKLEYEKLKDENIKLKREVADLKKEVLIFTYFSYKLLSKNNNDKIILKYFYYKNY